MTRNSLTLVFTFILITMLAVTTYASFDRSVFKAGAELTSDRWFQATLVDAYFGFATFYVWVFYKERSSVVRIIWFVLIVTLGNIAMSVYVLIQIWKWDSRTSAEGILLRQPTETAT